jgi:hypothetical protein
MQAQTHKHTGTHIYRRTDAQLYKQSDIIRCKNMQIQKLTLIYTQVLLTSIPDHSNQKMKKVKHVRNVQSRGIIVFRTTFGEI